MAEVFLIRTDDRVKGIQAIFSHFDSIFKDLKDKNVAIKPNFNTADPPPASTDIRIIREVINHLKSCMTKKITVVERAGPVDTHETMKTKGLFDLQKKIGGFEILDLSTMPESEWTQFTPKGSHWKNGFLFPKFIQNVDAIIALPCLKTHRYGGHFTFSLKLSVGLVPRQGYEYMQELHSSSHMRDLIAEINEAYSPTLIILDGVDSFIEGGPEDGKLAHSNVMLASTDRIAIDAVGVAILRDLGTTPEVTKGKIFEQKQIARAVELSLGVSSPSEITITSADEESTKYANHLRTFLED
ncbi:MAG: DUF362 domain-containing protein [Candidatus Heimdallarchaeota archaeon]|nr:MAG: DUF362 domain-containing protein [Candidatus Heimdallarchaeota archaeon]